MKQFRLPAGAFGAVLLLSVTAAFAQPPAPGGAPAGGQQGRGGPPPPPQNLQVLPKDIPVPELLAAMRGFTQALGVQCTYCHVREGQGGRNDMASDEKQPKKTARLMLQMTNHVNEMITGGVGKPAADVSKVTCATCHRGAAIPKVDPPPAQPPAQAPPAAATPGP